MLVHIFHFRMQLTIWVNWVFSPPQSMAILFWQAPASKFLRGTSVLLVALLQSEEPYLVQPVLNTYLVQPMKP